MKVVRLVRSGWWDDVVNGDAGRTLTLEDALADEHVARGNAVYDGPQWDLKPVTVPETEATFVGQEAAARRMEALTQALSGEPSPEDAPAELKMPWSNASKAAWVDWAVHCGADPAEAAGSTKNQLMSRYGERL